MNRETILALIEKNPGINRQQIFIHLGKPDIPSNELTNGLTALRRQGKIENRGTRKNPSWYRTEQNEPKSKDDLMDIIRESDERLRRSLDHISKQKFRF